MRSLLEYAQTEYPDHELELWRPVGAPLGPVDVLLDPPTTMRPTMRRPTDEPTSVDDPDDLDDVDDLELAPFTVIAHVVGLQPSCTLAQQLHDAGWPSATAVLVTPAATTVVPHAGGDPDGVTDLPTRRPLVAAAVGGLTGAVAIGVVATIISDPRAGLVAGSFGLLAGGVAGAMAGGLGRHAGERAWSQPHAPGRVMGLVAIPTDDERTATAVAEEMERADPHDIRIVGVDGFWHTPNTF